MAVAEDVERQEAAVFVVAVEEGVLLAPVGLHVGGVDIEGDACGRRPVGVEEQGDEQVGEFLEVGGYLTRISHEAFLCRWICDRWGG